MNNRNKDLILGKQTSLGIELGSTRIKAVLIGEDYAPIATGGHNWENKLENGFWTYSLDEVWDGLQKCYKSLAENVQEQYGIKLESVGSFGVSGMMHGYLVFDKADKQLVPFRTWRNTNTGEAAGILTEKFSFNIPQRWNISHLYQAILNEEEHVKNISFITTLAGYVHWKLSGQKVLGVGEASGVFPVNSDENQFDQEMISVFGGIVADKNLGWELSEIFPTVLSAGDSAGKLTPEGAKLLDPSGDLQHGIPMCPPEGDAGTGMTATNSVAECSGNVSAGTSVFAMVVLEKPLSKVHPEIDIVCTPSGKPVAMVHCNNCSSDIDAYVKVFSELLENMGSRVNKNDLYFTLYNLALKADADGGGLLAYNYYSGEHTTGFDEGRPLLVRTANSSFSLGNLMRTLIYSAIATLRLGMDILTRQEHVVLEKLLGHGGLFKTEGVAQQLMAGALNVPVVVMESAGEGGAWGIALLAAYMQRKAESETLEAFLDEKVFANNAGTSVLPLAEDVAGFEVFIEKYKKGLAIERAAVENFG